LRAELATQHGSIAGVDFVFPGRAFTATTKAIFASAGVDADLYADNDGAWSGSRLALRVLRALRTRRAEPDFARVARSLEHGSAEDMAAAVGTRELAFAGEVAGVV